MIKRCLLLGRKAMTNLDSILKSRDIPLPTKVHLVKAMVFPVVMYGCESWTIKKVEHRRIDAFELWCWRRLLRVPWTARRSNLRTDYPKGDQSWIFFGRTDAEVEAPIIWPPDVKNWLIGKDPDAEEDWRLKNWCFELEWWRRLLRVPWTARSSNQSILKEINPGYSLEGLMLKLQYFGHLMQRANSLERHWCWERLRLGGEGAMEHEMVGWHHRLKGHEFKQTSGDSEA